MEAALLASFIGDPSPLGVPKATAFFWVPLQQGHCLVWRNETNSFSPSEVVERLCCSMDVGFCSSKQTPKGIKKKCMHVIFLVGC